MKLKKTTKKGSKNPKELKKSYQRIELKKNEKIKKEQFFLLNYKKKYKF